MRRIGNWYVMPAVPVKQGSSLRKQILTVDIPQFFLTIILYSLGHFSSEVTSEHSVVYWGGNTQSSWAFMCIMTPYSINLMSGTITR